jgi:hypothetical protein
MASHLVMVLPLGIVVELRNSLRVLVSGTRCPEGVCTQLTRVPPDCGWG